LTRTAVCNDLLVIEVLGDTLPYAVGMLLSPTPIIAALLILLSPSGTAGGVIYGLRGWWAWQWSRFWSHC
jgi:hypothetical protein